MFKRYATGNESDRSIAAWLNARGARTNRDHPFSKDTVREMLCNAAYAGYVSGLRDKSRTSRGFHEAIISDELFDRVQEVRSWRTTVVRPGRRPRTICCASCCAASAAALGCTAPAAPGPASVATNAPPVDITATATRRWSPPSPWRSS